MITKIFPLYWGMTYTCICTYVLNINLYSSSLQALLNFAVPVTVISYKNMVSVDADSSELKLICVLSCFECRNATLG